MRLSPGILLVALALTACGEPSAQEERAAWARDADEICAKARDSIAKRGAPTGPENLVKLSKAGAADLREAVDDVLAIEVPETGNAIAPVRKAMRDARPSLDELARLGPRATVDEASGLVDALGERSEDLPAMAEAAGLKTCGAEKLTAAALDGVKGPLFEIAITDLATRFQRRLAAIRRAGRASPAAAHDAMIHLRAAIGVWQVKFDEQLAPTWAEEPFDRYKDAVLAFRAVQSRANDVFLDENGPVSPTQARDAMDRIERGEAKLAAAARELRRTLGQRLREG